ncbi:P-loop containing nucleoside triphosphate hydrolase protein [Lophiostoma macrostomum CBS 122681]|uniref:P-loop containing nucleoside triphosphate hydrolase protein n=1 Tax=Lophiostoma macrostomum CBS 122681 TaxID=1314788 RepID=A0A6A6TRK2_9PLEO|nr:P-loop containing nucleoside triphosphate hydrolase protein [Lophiostoma macrostomum CBS 122681]
MSSQDVAMLSSSSSHRLPTVSASQALEQRHSRGSRAVSTGLTQLNKILSPPGLPGRDVAGGLVRGKVTEIYGPSGVGKTALGIQAAAHALRAGQSVIWVDAAAPLVARRVEDVLSALRQDADVDVADHDLQRCFHHLMAPTLAHLLALFGHPPSAFPPPNTSLIVIDSLATLVDNAYPRSAVDRTSRNRNDQAKWAAGRKYTVINELISTFTRVAAMHDIALLLTCQTITRIRGGSRALLVPAISGADWENGVSTRLVLFRDWVPGQGKWNDADADKLRKARFIGVVKANGVTLAEEGAVGNVVPFTIEASGLCDLNVAAVDIAPAAVAPPLDRPLKRRFTEIGDSDIEPDPDSDELYGWDDEVAAEGLLIEEADEVVTADAPYRAGSRTDRVPGSEDKKVSPTRPATL